MCTLMAGVMLVIMGLTGTGTAVKYIPRPVIIGFTNGIALVIASTQLQDFLGLTIDVPGEFIGRIEAIAANLPAVSARQRRAWRRHAGAADRLEPLRQARARPTSWRCSPAPRAAIALRPRCRDDRIAIRRHPVGAAAVSRCRCSSRS